MTRSTRTSLGSGGTWIHLLAVIAFTLGTGCAKLTPGHPHSGWRADDQAHGKKVTAERLRVVTLTPAEAQVLKKLAARQALAGNEAQSLAAVGSAVLGWALAKAADALRKDIQSAAARHVSAYQGEVWDECFYLETCGAAGPILATDSFNLTMNLGGLLVMREVQLPDGECPTEAVVDQVDGIFNPPPNPWCLVMTLGFEADRQYSQRHGVFRLRPIEGSLVILASRAKIGTPSWWRPWTWWTDSKNNTWWGPTKGDKDYLDQLEVEIEIEPIYATATLESVAATDRVQKASWRFDQLTLGASDLSVRADGQPQEASWSGPLAVVPVGTVTNEVLNGRPVPMSGTGLYIVRAKLTEKDSMAERLGDMAKLVEEKSEDAIKWVTDKVAPEAAPAPAPAPQPAPAPADG